MFRLCLSAFFIAVFTTAALAQDKLCALKLLDSPEVRGFRLGQTVEQVKAKFPDNIWLDESDDTHGPSIVLLDRGELRRDKSYEGLEGVTLRFLDKKLADITLKYSSETKWASQEEFRNVVAENLKLPTAGWKGSHSQTLTCDDFIVETNSGLGITGGRIQIKLRGYESEIERRKLQKDTERKKVFKP